MYLFLTEKVPLYHTSYWQMVPSLQLGIPFNCRKCNVFKIWVNHKTTTFSRLCHCDLYTLRRFLQSEKTDFPTISYTWSLTKAPHSGEPRRKGHYRKYAPPPAPRAFGRDTDCWYSSGDGVHFKYGTIGCTKQSTFKRQTINKPYLMHKPCISFFYIDGFSYFGVSLGAYVVSNLKLTINALSLKVF